jgi:hypothetical protein
MKALVSTFLLLAQVCRLQAQPVNDHCANATAMTVGTEICTSMDNSSTQEPSETYSSCVPVVNDRSIWFTFVANASNMSIGIYQNSTESITNQRWCFSVYHTTTCFPVYASTGVGCVCADDLGGNNSGQMTLNLTNLVIGDGYFIQVTYKPGMSAAPDFCLLVAPTTECASCPSPCGEACTFTSYSPTTNQVVSSCNTYVQSPLIEGSANTPPVNTECFTFTANKSQMNCRLLLRNSTSTPACNSGITWTWSLYSQTCMTLQTGSHSSILMGNAASPLIIGNTYTLCYTFQIATDNCFATLIYPYVYPNFILPIQIVSFTGTQTEDFVALSWSTASEWNNDYFVVQRSVNGIDFTDLGIVDGNGTSPTGFSYSFNDLLPLEGVNYYRLKQMDFANAATSGEPEFSVSDVIVVRYSPEEMFSFSLKRQFADFRLFGSGPSTVVIFDQQGVVVYRKIVYAPADIHVPTANKRGLWFACLLRGKEKELMVAFGEVHPSAGL